MEMDLNTFHTSLPFSFEILSAWMQRIAKRFFSERRLLKVEHELLQNPFDMKLQRQLFKELLATQNYKRLQLRFENPTVPSVSSHYSVEKRQQDIEKIQKDPVILDSYINALVMDGKGSIVEKLTPFLNQDVRKEDPPPQTITEARPHWVHTDLDKWQKEVDAKQPNSRFASTKRGIPRGKDDGPIQVVLSEAWSWSKLARNFGSRLFYGILIMTGLSVVLEQQGILKSGNLS
jgi:hypothetical protein